MIEDTQPYRRGSGEGDPLWLLHHMNNADKHRVLNIAVVTASAMSYTFGSEGPDDPHPGGLSAAMVAVLRNMHRPFVHGSEVARFKRDVQVDPKFSLTVRFGDGEPAIARRSVFPLLRMIHKRVDEIVDSFAGELQ